MHDAPTAVLKSKNSSIAIGTTLHKEGKADAFVSRKYRRGNVCRNFDFRKNKGVSRPTIGTFIPSETGQILLVDAGANVDSRPQHL